MKYLLDFENKEFDIKMLSGNHENMLMEFIDEVYALAKLEGQEIATLDKFWELADKHCSDSCWAKANGGDTTLMDMRRNIRSLDELNQLHKKISELPYHIETKCNGLQFYLVHGSPAKQETDRMLWEPADVLDDYSKYADYVVFGHRLTSYYQQEASSENDLFKVFYGENRIGIDTGAAYPDWGGCVSFLRLNDLQAFYYKIERP